MPLRLPGAVTACLFDLDGVITRTSEVHEAAWKQMFDDFLTGWSGRHGVPFVPFRESDYRDYVDGKPRADGTRGFLASRHIDLPEGDPDDPAGADTVQGLSRRKNDIVLSLLRTRGVAVYPGSVAFVREARRAGLRTAVVSSSANTPDVLAAAGITDLFEERVDGNTIRDQHLAGKPAPDTFLYAARLLGVAPSAGAVFEDALAGVEAGRAGGFGWVVGVDRLDQAEALVRHGADVVVSDLSELMD